MKLFFPAFHVFLTSYAGHYDRLRSRHHRRQRIDLRTCNKYRRAHEPARGAIAWQPHAHRGVPNHLGAVLLARGHKAAVA